MSIKCYDYCWHLLTLTWQAMHLILNPMSQVYFCGVMPNMHMCMFTHLSICTYIYIYTGRQTDRYIIYIITLHTYLYIFIDIHIYLYVYIYHIYCPLSGPHLSKMSPYNACHTKVSKQNKTKTNKQNKQSQVKLTKVFNHSYAEKYIHVYMCTYV